MRVDDIMRILLRHWGPLLVSVALGALAGFAGSMMAPASYVSTARTSVSAAATEGSVDALYQVTQAIRVMMPQYTSWAESEEVAAKAFGAAGVRRDQIADTQVASSPDSTVLEWTMKGTEPQAVQAMLDASLRAFGDRVRTSAPRASGKPVVTVKVDAPASKAERSTLVPMPLAIALGASLGFFGWLLYALSRSNADRRAYDAEEIERELDTVVVGELPRDSSGHDRAWGYVGSFVMSRCAPGQILLVGGAKAPSAADVGRLQRAMDDQAPGQFNVTPARLSDAQTPQAVSHAHAVILLLTRGQEDLDALKRECHSLRTVCRGPVAAVLQHA